MTIQPTVVYQSNSLNTFPDYSSLATTLINLVSGSYAIGSNANEMPALVKSVYIGLGGTNPAQIPDSPPDGNTIYQVSVSAGGVVSFSIVKENFNQLSQICPQPIKSNIYL